MKYIDEYRDHRIAHALAAEITGRATRRWVLMEICGGQTHTIMRYGLDELLGDKYRTGARPRLPRLRHSAGDDRQGHRVGIASGCHAGFLRRHAAGSGLALGPVPGQGQGRRCARCLHSAGGAEDRTCASRAPRRVSGDRLRDHRSGQCHGRAGRPGRKACEIFPCWFRRCWFLRRFGL